jgi:GT2 family glycosyltransferase
VTRGVTIVIPTWNGLALLKRFLPSVIAAARHYNQHSLAPTEIIVVDDGSTDSTVEWLLGESKRLEDQKLGVDLRVLRSESNRGFGEACNLGFASASQPLVFLLNNDVEPAIDSIAPLVENFRDPLVFAVHCRVFDSNSGLECGTGKLGRFARGFIRVHKSYVPRQPNQQGGEGFYSMFAGGGSAMFDRRKFLDIGGFEPLLSPFYWEDVELSYRAWKRGFVVRYEPRAVARHSVSSTIGKLPRRKVRTIEQRNRLLFHWIQLHDWRMLASHATWVLLLAISAPLRLRPEFVSSCVSALKLLPRVRKRRREQKRQAKRSDREVFGLFFGLERRDDLLTYDDRSELNLKLRERRP